MATGLSTPIPLPSQAELNQLLRYDPETGKLYWRRRADEWFADSRCGNTWNTKHAGKEAFATIHNKGYLVGAIRNQMLLAHRVIWKMVTGEEPDEIDHQDGDKANNRWSNLRNVSHAENAKNLGIGLRNRSGAIGITLCSHTSKWRAQGRVVGARFSLGYFDSFEAAVEARRAWERENGFHENHGNRFTGAVPHA